MSPQRYDAAGLGGGRARLPWLSVAGYSLAGILTLAISNLIADRLGVTIFIGVLGGILLGTLLLVISFRNLAIPFFLLILSIGGFRFLWGIRTPILPDLSLDRIALTWLALVFMVKYVSERRPLRGPFAIDLLLFVHGLYLLVSVIIDDMETFHAWTMSTMIPYGTYFFAKNIISNKARARSYLWVLLALSVYYNIHAVAEKYAIDWLIWPKHLTGIEAGFRYRSVGPFEHAPLFGTVIGMLLPVHLYFVATVRNSLGKVLIGASFLVGLAGLYFTYTRGSWLAGIVALAVAVWLNRRAYLRYFVPVLVLAPVLAVAVIGVAQDKFMKERLENEDTVGSRFGTAVTVLRVWRDHPLFGVGYYQYQNIRDQYIQPVEIPGMAPIRFVQFRHNSIHDIYLGPLAETGLFGMGLQFSIYYLVWSAMRQHLRRRSAGGEFENLITPVLGGMIVGYLAGGLAIDYRFFSVVATLFLVSAGILAGYRPEPLVATEMASGHGQGGIAGYGPSHRLQSEV